MLPWLILQIDSSEYNLFELTERIDLNTATFEEISQIPFLTDKDVEFIVRERPFSSLKEIAEALKLTDIELKVLRNIAYLSKPQRRTSSALILSTNLEGIRYYGKLAYGGSYLMLRGRGDTFSFRIHAFNIYVGNFKAYPNYGYRGMYMSMRTHYDNLSFMFNNDLLTLYTDTSSNFLYALKYSFLVLGAIGRFASRKFIYFALKDLPFIIEAIHDFGKLEGLRLGFWGSFGNTYFNVQYRSYGDVWDNFPEGRYVSMSFRYKHGNITVGSLVSSRYTYHNLTYRITPTSKLYVRFLRNGFKLGFSNSEPFRMELTNYTYGRVLKLSYMFVSTYIYDTEESIYIYDESFPLYSSGVFLKGRGSKLSVNFKYRFLKVRYMDGSFWVSISLSF